MNAAGFVFMVICNALVMLLTVYCFFRVLTTPAAAAIEHAPLEIDTRDLDA